MHFIEQVDAVTIRARRMEMIPIELVAPRIATGSFLDRNADIADGTVLADLVFEVFEKDDANHGQEPLSGSRLAMVTPALLARLRELTLRPSRSSSRRGGAGRDVLRLQDRVRHRLPDRHAVVADVIDSDSGQLCFGDKDMSKQAYRDGSQSLPDIKRNFDEVAALTERLVRGAGGADR